MHKSLILTTAGVCLHDAMKIRSYCQLLKFSLTDEWLFADDFVRSHVCFIRNDYVSSIRTNNNKSSIIYVYINVSGEFANTKRKYQITMPLTGEKIKRTLNEISKNETLENFIEETVEKTSILEKFKSKFSDIRKNYFGKKEIQQVSLEQENKKSFISKLSKRINVKNKIKNKLVFVGSPGCGKTTLIQVASDGVALGSDVSSTDSVANEKPKTTVGIDYATIRLKNGEEVNLIGTPGQVKYNFIWDIVGKNANAIIILLDMSRPEPFEYLKFYLNFIKSEIGVYSRIFCALTHIDLSKSDIHILISKINSYYKQIQEIFIIDPRVKSEVFSMIEKASKSIPNNSRMNKNKLLVAKNKM